MNGNERGAELAVLSLEVAELVSGYLSSRGADHRVIDAACIYAGRLLTDGERSYSTILAAVNRRLAEDPAALMEEALEDERARLRLRRTSVDTGAKPAAPRKGSPHAVHRSSRRQPGARWDQEREDL